MPGIVFATRLTEADWDDTLRGWRCPPLAVPGAIVEALYVDGNRVDMAKYEVLAEHTFIRWTPPDQPQRITASIKLTEELTLGAETDRWKKLAIVLPVAATIVSAGIAGTATYLSKAAPLGRSPASTSTTGNASIPPPSAIDSPQTTNNTHVSRAKALIFGQAERGIATPELSWFKFFTDNRNPRKIRILIRNINLLGALEAQVLDSNESMIKSDTEAGKNVTMELPSSHPGAYYVAIRAIWFPIEVPFEVVITVNEQSGPN